MFEYRNKTTLGGRTPPIVKAPSWTPSISTSNLRYADSRSLCITCSNYHTIDNHSHETESSGEVGHVVDEPLHAPSSDLPIKRWIIDEPIAAPDFAMHFRPDDCKTEDAYDRVINRLKLFAVEKEPNDLCKWRNLADAYEFKAISHSGDLYKPHEDLDRAIRAWEMGLGIRTKPRAEFRMRTGRLYMRKGDYDEAIRVFEPVVESYEHACLCDDEFATNSLKPWLWDGLGMRIGDEVITVKPSWLLKS